MRVRIRDDSKEDYNCMFCRDAPENIDLCTPCRVSSV